MITHSTDPLPSEEKRGFSSQESDAACSKLLRMISFGFLNMTRGHHPLNISLVVQGAVHSLLAAVVPCHVTAALHFSGMIGA